MIGSSLFSELNIIGHCKKVGLSTWQCPHFLFVLMGAIIIAAILFTYAVGSRYVQDPLAVAFITIVLAGILLTIAFIITDSFQRLAETNQLKSEFVNVVSHQLRSPLSNLQWSMEVLGSGKAGKASQDQLPYFQIFRENTARMQDLVNDLLTVSRISQGKLPLAKKEFSFKELMHDVLSEFDAWLKASNIKIVLEEDAGMQKITSDPSMVRHVVQNFLDNAIRYGKDTIRVRYAKQGSRLRVEVEDNGVGIPKEDQKLIFQKFFRSNNALKHQTEGSGLGLYIAQSMIERLGGEIGFTSKETKGSTFWFTIPIT